MAGVDAFRRELVSADHARPRAREHRSARTRTTAAAWTRWNHARPFQSGSEQPVNLALVQLDGALLLELHQDRQKVISHDCSVTGNAEKTDVHFAVPRAEVK